MVSARLEKPQLGCYSHCDIYRDDDVDIYCDDDADIYRDDDADIYRDDDADIYSDDDANLDCCNDTGRERMERDCSEAVVAAVLSQLLVARSGLFMSELCERVVNDVAIARASNIKVCGTTWAAHVHIGQRVRVCRVHMCLGSCIL